MKKNLISVIILALCVANFVLTAILMFAVLPETKKANALIDDIAAAIKLDLQSGAGSGSSYPIDQQEEYAVNGGEAMNIIFKNDGSKEDHYCVIKVTLMVNNKSENYKEMITNQGLSKKQSIITDEINTIISSKTTSEFKADQAAVKSEILSQLQEYFGVDFIIDVMFTSVMTQ